MNHPCEDRSMQQGTADRIMTPRLSTAPCSNAAP